MGARDQRFGTASLPDGTRVAYASTGAGPHLLVAPGWLSHLELGWSIPAERMFHEALSSGRTLVRYDRPGCGLSDPYAGPRTMALELATIRAVTEALGATSFDLLGWSLGAAVAAQWAADRPETVVAMVLYGGWATGSAIGDEDSKRHLLGLVATHWGLGSDLLTDLFAPETDAGTRRALAQYQRAASSAETAVALLGLAYDLDVRPALARVTAPTLVLHRSGDRAAPPRRAGRSPRRSRVPSSWSSRAARTSRPWATRRPWSSRYGVSSGCLDSGGPCRPASPRARPRWRRWWPTASPTASWPSASASPNGRPSRTWSGSGSAWGSGPAPRWPPGTCRASRQVR